MFDTQTRARAIFVTAAVAFSAPALSASWSGTYVASGSNVSFYLQLVESSDGAVIGRFKQVSVRKDNKLNTLDAFVSGAASGDQFVGKIEAGWDRGGNITISGKRVPGGLYLTGAGGLRVNLRPGTEEDEARAIAALQQEVQQAASAEAQQKDLAKRVEFWRKRTEAFQRILSSSSTYVEKGSLSYMKFASHPDKYEATTAKLEELLQNVKATTANTSEAIGRRSTLTASMLHVKIDSTEHPQIEVKHGYDASMREWKDLEAKIAAANKACLEVTPTDIDVKAFKVACSRTPTVRELVRTAGESSKAEYFKIRDVYLRELAKQESLRVEAEKVSRAFDRR